MIVVEKMYDKFLGVLKAKVEKIKVGPSDDPKNYMGPIVNKTSEEKIFNIFGKVFGGRVSCLWR